MSIAALLFDLQTCDLELDGLRARLASLQASMGETEAVRAARLATEKAQKDLSAARAVLLDRELELKHVEEHLANVQGTLYGGSVRNPRELLSLQQESESLTRQKDRLESAVLEAMELVDGAQAALRSAQAEQTQAEAQWTAAQAQTCAEVAAVSDRIAAATKQRNALAAQVPAKTLAIYDALRKEKAGRAVAKLEHASCMGCGVMLSSGEAQHARSLAAYGLAYCTNCGRILYAGH